MSPPFAANSERLAEQAEQQANSLRFWFRQQYALAPTDPRYLAMTDEEIGLEYEMHLCASGEVRKTCHKCGLETFRKSCPRCNDSSSLTGDPVIDSIAERIAAGEVVDLETELRKPLSDAFVPITPDDIVTGSG